MKEEFEMKRTELAGYFADSGAALLAYMGSSSALAAIPDSEPPRYVVAGTPEEIVKLLPAAGAIAELVAAQPTAASAASEGLTTWPERIWLQHGCDEVPSYADACGVFDGVTWCEDHISRTDVEYVRADLATQSAKQGAANPVEPSALVASIAELDAWLETDGCDPLTVSQGESIGLVLHELKRLRDVCPECKGTGMADSGGVHPWGEPALIPCGCDRAAAPTSHAQVLAEVRDQALEEAASVYMVGAVAAREIRKLKTTASASNEQGGAGA
jgi:hypothetical protein